MDLFLRLSKSLFLILIAFGLAYLTNCGQKGNNCDDDERIHFYSKSWYETYNLPVDGNKGYEVSFCPDFEGVPCDGVDAAGNPIDLENLFKYPCKDYGEAIQPDELLVEEPYEFQCKFGGDLCTEFDTYYFDFTDGSYDFNGRPFYIRFRTFDWDISQYNYVFELYDIDRQSFLSTRVVSNSNQNNESVLRYINPPICDNPPCLAEGVVKHSLGLIAGPGNFQIRMYKEDRETGGKVELGTTDFKVVDYEGNFTNNNRRFVIKLFKTQNYDITQNRIADMNFYEATEATFGDQKANLRIEYDGAPELLKDNEADGNDALMLDYSSYDPNLDIESNISTSLGDWLEKKYRNTYQTQQDRAISMEALTMLYYDFSGSNPEPVENFELEFEILNSVRYFGITYSRPNINTDYYNASVTFRLPILTRISDMGDLNEDAQVMATFLHELGHSWSSIGVDNFAFSDCEVHTNFGNGENLYNCLWQTACIGTGSGNTYTLEEFLLQRQTDPVFCEGHYQRFMNSLKPKYRNQ